MKTLAYFGFAANPPHLGHLKAIEWLASQVDQVLVSPSASHAFGKKLKLYRTRLKWTNMLIQTSTQNLKNVTVSDIESEMFWASANQAPVYSYDVLCKLQSLVAYRDYKILLAVGPDNVETATWQKFYRYKDIDADFGKIVIPEIKEVVRSTDIRNLLTTRMATREYLTQYVGDLLAVELFNYNGESKW